jgi:hypothetical protein
MLFSRSRVVHNPGMSVGAWRPAGIVLMTLSAFGAASCGSSSKPAAVTIGSSASTSTSISTAPATTSTTSTAVVEGTTTSTSPSLSNWTTPADDPDGSIAVATFNARLDAEHPTWATSPERVAKEFLNADTIDASSVATQLTALSPQAADVVVKADGLRDDSVHAARYNLHLVRQPDQTWRLATATWSQQCQPDRGHQNFTTELCV